MKPAQTQKKTGLRGVINITGYYRQQKQPLLTAQLLTSGVAFANNSFLPKPAPG